MGLQSFRNEAALACCSGSGIRGLRFSKVGGLRHFTGLFCESFRAIRFDWRLGIGMYLGNFCLDKAVKDPKP